MGRYEAMPGSPDAYGAFYTDARLMAEIKEQIAAGQTPYSIAQALGINSAHIHFAQSYDRIGPTLRQAAIDAGWFARPEPRRRAAFDASRELQAAINSRAEELGISRSVYLELLVVADFARAAEAEVEAQ